MRLIEKSQSSPIAASWLAPAALKYRRLTERRPLVRPYHRRMRSTIAFDSAYTLSGRIGADSTTGTSAGVPYTEHEDEKTMSRTPARIAASTRRAVPSTLLRQYLPGDCIDSPTDL